MRKSTRRDVLKASGAVTILAGVSSLPASLMAMKTIHSGQFGAIKQVRGLC